MDEEVDVGTRLTRAADHADRHGNFDMDIAHLVQDVREKSFLEMDK